MKKKSKHQICRELAAVTIHTMSELLIKYDILRTYMDDDETQATINEATIISARCHIDLSTVISQIISDNCIKIIDKKKSSKIMKKNKLKEQKQNLIEHLLDISHAKTEGRKIIIALLEEIKVIDNKLDKKKRKQPLFLLEHGLADIGDFKPISVKSKECLDYYDKLMSVLRPTFDVDQKIIDKLKAHKDRVCSELAEKSPFRINDFEDEYDKIKLHFPKNILRHKLHIIAEFATSVGCRMYHVGNFLIENKSTS